MKREVTTYICDWCGGQASPVEKGRYGIGGPPDAWAYLDDDRIHIDSVEICGDCASSVRAQLEVIAEQCKARRGHQVSGDRSGE